MKCVNFPHSDNTLEYICRNSDPGPTCSYWANLKKKTESKEVL